MVVSDFRVGFLFYGLENRVDDDIRETHFQGTSVSVAEQELGDTPSRAKSP